MPYREELDAAMARAAAAEADLDDARAENAHDHERMADLEAKLADARKQLAKLEAKPKPEAPKAATPKEPRTRSERARREILERVDKAYTAVEKQKDEPTGLVGNAIRSLNGWFALAFFCATLFFHMFGFPALGSSPAALACPFQCSGCRAPARVFSWTYRGSGHDEKGREGYALVCTNGAVDIRTLTEDEVRSSKNRKLQPYLMNGFVVLVIEAVALFPIALLAFGAIRGPQRKRRVASERAKLEEALRNAEAELAAFDESRS